MSESLEFSIDKNPSTPLLRTLERAQQTALQSELTPEDRVQLQEEIKAVNEELRRRGEVASATRHPVEDLISREAIEQVFKETVMTVAAAIEATIRASREKASRDDISMHEQQLNEGFRQIIEMLKKYPWLDPHNR